MEDSTPILVGCGQFTQKCDDPRQALPPMGIAGEAAKAALDDTGIGAALAPQVDTVAVVRIFPDSGARRAHDFGRAENPPRAVARRIGANPANAIYSQIGGQSPQTLVSEMAERITAGEVEVVVLAGAEAIVTERAARRQGITLDWHEEDDGSQEDRGLGEMFVSMHELAHGIGIPINTYPLFENAIRGHLGRSVDEHMLEMGKLFAPFTKIAANNPYAYYPTERSVEELATVTSENRWIGFPYPKWFVAQDNIDQGAALIMTSVGKARELGIDPAKWVFIHGVGEAKESNVVIDRVNFWSSPAMRVNAAKAFDMAGIGLDAVDYIDLYSCFPSAVEQMCDAVGLAYDDPRGLTLTGGLPYFGGPGNNYSMHGIAEAMRSLRANPGSFALVTANGGVISKHATGIYSTTPTEGTWQRVDPATYKHEVAGLPRPAVTETPEGRATVETYTVVHDRNGPRLGIVVGVLTDTGNRFCANTPDDPAVLADMMERDQLGRQGMVSTTDGKSTFVAN